MLPELQIIFPEDVPLNALLTVKYLESEVQENNFNNMANGNLCLNVLNIIETKNSRKQAEQNPE